MTKHFCDFCGEEIEGSFIYKQSDILCNIEDGDFRIEVLLITAACSKFIMICEKCVMRKINKYFSDRVKEFEADLKKF